MNEKKILDGILWKREEWENSTISGSQLRQFAAMLGKEKFWDLQQGSYSLSGNLFDWLRWNITSCMFMLNSVKPQAPVTFMQFILNLETPVPSQNIDP